MSASLIPLLLQRFTLRHWRGAPKQSALLVLILALGVAVFVSIRLANRAAVASFTRFTDTLTGQSDWIVQAPAGTLPESVLPEIRTALKGAAVHIVPVVEATASQPSVDGKNERFGRTSFTLLGVDLLGLANLAREQDRPFFGQQATGRGEADSETGAKEGKGMKANDNFWTVFGGEPRVWVSRALAEVVPERLELVLDENVVTIPVAGVIPSTVDAPSAPATLMIFDLPQLQKLTGKMGRVDRVEFLIEAGPRADERRAELKDVLEQLGRNGERWTVIAPGADRSAAETMTRAFRLNLTVLSLIALLVGMYLIFQALDGAVVRRRPEIAILRSLGVEESVIRRVWLWESAMLGLAGGGLGLLLGWAGAQASVRAVGQTVNALYYGTTVKTASLDGTEIAVGLGLGLISALVAGWWPAREAARTPPAQVLHRSAAPVAGARWARSFALGAGLVVAGVICAQLPPLRFEGGARFPLAGYAAALFWLLGGGVLCAFLLPPFARLARGWGGARPSVRIALSHLRKPSGRHRLAAAALLCAIGMTAGMAILVGSFEDTMLGWVRRTLQADLYVSSSGAQSATSRNRITAEAAAKLAAHPAVERASMLVSYPILFEGGQTLLNGVDLSVGETRPDLSWVQRPETEAVFTRGTNEGLAIVSESFSERFRKTRGDMIRVPAPAGVKALTIAGVFADYGNERGSILVERASVRGWFGDESVTSVGLFVKPGVNADALRAELLGVYPGLSVFTNASLRAEVLRIFRQTFSITYALEVIGVVVAVVGLALTLASMLLDRREELTTLRALGFTHREIAWAAAAEGFAVSVSAAVGGLVVSLGLGWLLIYVINKQSFGWTLGFSLPWGQLAALAVAVTATGLAVSYAVGRWGADLPADREE
jgi:putative ABC transport system permease protein